MKKLFLQKKINWLLLHCALIFTVVLLDGNVVLKQRIADEQALPKITEEHKYDLEKLGG